MSRGNVLAAFKLGCDMIYALKKMSLAAMVSQCGTEGATPHSQLGEAGGGL